MILPFAIGHRPFILSNQNMPYAGKVNAEKADVIVKEMNAMKEKSGTFPWNSSHMV